MIPQTYKQWHNCIVNECRIDLTEEFIQERLDILKNGTREETRRMVSLYGKKHLENLITWFTTADQKNKSEQININ